MSTYDIITKITLLLAVLLLLYVLFTSSLNPFKETVQDKVAQANGNIVTRETCDLKLTLGQEDTDKDGVPDSCDYCAGAPETDTDGDGVPDGCDKNKDVAGELFKNECKNIISEKDQKCAVNPSKT